MTAQTGLCRQKPERSVFSRHGSNTCKIGGCVYEVLTVYLNLVIFIVYCDMRSDNLPGDLAGFGGRG